MGTSLLGVLWVGAVAGVAAVVALLSRRLAGERQEQDNTANSTVFTLVGGLHAVLLVFVLIALFDSTNTAQDDSYREANSLVAVSWAGEALPEPARSRIQDLTRQYARTVIEQEWPQMRDGQQVDNTGWAQLDDMLLAVQQAETTDDWQQQQRGEAAARLWEVYQARQDRLNASGDGVSLIVWFALIAGSLVAVTLPYLFSGTTLGTHIVVTASMAATIALLLFAIYQLQNPFSGGAQVDPDAFQAALDRLS